MEEYKVTLEYCINLIASGLSREIIRKKLYFAFQFIYNFEVFCKFFLPNAFTKDFAWFHLEIIDEFWDDKDAVLASFRGSGKSSLVGQGMVLHRICYKREKYILYSSQNSAKAEQFLEPISFELKTNNRLKLVYPNIDIRKVKSEETGKDRNDCFDIGRDMRVQAFSFEKNARGFKFNNQRPTLIIFDDIDSDERVMNPVLREKDHNKLAKQMIPALDAEIGKYKMIGTIIHLDSVLNRQLTKVGGKVFRAYELDVNNKIIPSSILWPEMFTLKYFEKYIHDFGSMAASSEFLNNPVDDVSSLIKRAWIKSCFCEDLSFSDNQTNYDIRLQGVDFAFSDRITADKSAFVGIGKNDDCIDMISCITKKGMSIIEQFDFIEYLTGIHEFDDNALEENSIRSMSKEIKRYNFKFTLFWTGAADRAKGEKDYLQMEYTERRHTVGKVSMMKRLATMFENNYNSLKEKEGYTFRIPYKTDSDKSIAHEIMDECCSFALQDGKLVETGVHPDIPIGLQLAFELLTLDDVGDVGIEF